MSRKGVNRTGMSGSGKPKVKLCRDCGDLKPTTAFPMSQTNGDGRSNFCQQCTDVRSLRPRSTTRVADDRPVIARRKSPNGQRWCPDCDTTKDLEEFPHNKSSRGGHGRYCLPCHNARGRADKIKNHGSTREYHLRHRYGIGQADVDKMLAEQQGLCAGCGKPDPEHVDHDHETGVFRGMLCFNCNQALGNARDDIEVLQRLRNYLIVRRPQVIRRMGSEHRPAPELVIEVSSERAHCG